LNPMITEDSVTLDDGEVVTMESVVY
jgi:hypothetical protein